VPADGLELVKPGHLLPPRCPRPLPCYPPATGPAPTLSGAARAVLGFGSGSPYRPPSVRQGAHLLPWGPTQAGLAPQLAAREHGRRPRPGAQPRASRGTRLGDSVACAWRTGARPSVATPP